MPGVFAQRRKNDSLYPMTLTSEPFSLSSEARPVGGGGWCGGCFKAVIGGVRIRSPASATVKAGLPALALPACEARIDWKSSDRLRRLLRAALFVLKRSFPSELPRAATMRSALRRILYCQWPPGELSCAFFNRFFRETRRQPCLLEFWPPTA